MSFILLIPKWTCIKDPEEIEKRSQNTSSGSASTISANAQLSNNNCSKVLPKASPLSLVHNVENELSNSESIAGSEDKDEFDKEIDLFSEVVATEADQS